MHASTWRAGVWTFVPLYVALSFDAAKVVVSPLMLSPLRTIGEKTSVAFLISDKNAPEPIPTAPIDPSAEYGRDTI